jgi:hypothetical protein
MPTLFGVTMMLWTPIKTNNTATSTAGAAAAAVAAGKAFTWVNMLRAGNLPCTNHRRYCVDARAHIMVCSASLLWLRSVYGQHYVYGQLQPCPCLFALFIVFAAIITILCVLVA